MSSPAPFETSGAVSRPPPYSGPSPVVYYQQGQTIAVPMVQQEAANGPTDSMVLSSAVVPARMVIDPGMVTYASTGLPVSPVAALSPQQQFQLQEQERRYKHEIDMAEQKNDRLRLEARADLERAREAQVALRNATGPAVIDKTNNFTNISHHDNNSAPHVVWYYRTGYRRLAICLIVLVFAIAVIAGAGSSAQ